jgi:hypothetical protein
MKASEIISDDIVSREKHKTKDVVGKKTASQDYFGNRTDKRDDRALVSKDKKERKKEWFEEDEVDEGSMQAATHKKSGPKFGGYYGATQKGPPKKDQGFGGAAESVGSEISIKGKK